ncbi:hypothetical protein B0H16DRAFT_870160 [Mycena metata]|uniref:Uncharacterized protein n=1 Tax=Mycena metata TaxID=1033252 RepID=A0AAD7IV14_9AGAR|nr:hypothetical protein B0H16DRAFT_870160 [Mycena metata]
MHADMLEKNSESWLSQANLFFSFLQITSNFEDYVFVYHLHFKLAIPAPTKVPPAGFLFVCPEEDVQVDISGFRLPEYPAFWSLDPLGVDRLSLDQATDLGFPTIQCLTTFWGNSLDAGVYAGLRRFHKAKGFDPKR